MRTPATCHPDRTVCGNGLCRSCYSREWNRQHPKSDEQKFYKRNEYLKRVHGITETDYQRMLTDQSGCCGICKKSTNNLFIDHNHKTGKIRGLLCPRCNLALGHFLDNPRNLDYALQYITEGDNLSLARFEYFSCA